MDGPGEAGAATGAGAASLGAGAASLGAGAASLGAGAASLAGGGARAAFEEADLASYDGNVKTILIRFLFIFLPRKMKEAFTHLSLACCCCLHHSCLRFLLVS